MAQIVYQPGVDGDRPILEQIYPDGNTSTDSVTVVVVDKTANALVATAAFTDSGGNLVFATPANTITRTTGSWITNGFQVGTKFIVENTVSNDTTLKTGFLTVTVVDPGGLIITVADSLTGETILGSTASLALDAARAYQSGPDATLWLFDTANISGVDLEDVSFSQMNIKFTGTMSTAQSIDRRQTLVVNGAARQLSNANYLGAVWFDNVNGTDGTAYPIGTPASPCKTVDNAVAIATAIGVRTYKLYQGTMLLPSNHTEWIFEGVGSATNCTVDANSKSIDNSNFVNCTLTGTMTSGDRVTMITGIVVDVYNFQGICQQSGVGGDVFLPASANSFATFALCTDLPAKPDGSPLGAPIFDMGDNNGTRLWLRFFAGRYIVQNQAADANSICSLESISSSATLLSSVKGTIRTSGVFGTFVDSSTAIGRLYNHLNLDSSTTSGARTIDDAVWEETLADHLTAGSTGEALNDSATAVGVADAVWDAATSSHVVSGSMGETLGKKVLTFVRWLGLRNFRRTK